MTSTPQHGSRRPAGRGMLLLVLAVLAGVLAMHGLAPGGLAVAHVGHGHGRGVVMAHDDAGHPVDEDCSHAADGRAGGHASHADATCSATGVSTSYAPPPLLTAFSGTSANVGLTDGSIAATETGRAPPDLAQLQLLRI